MSRHLWPESAVVALLVVLVLVGLPAACIAESASTGGWSVLGRVSASSGLGYEGDQYGVELSRVADRLAVDLVASSATKTDGGDGYAARLVIEREIASGLYFGLRAVHSDFELYAKTTAGPVLTYRLPLDESLSLRLRLYGPNTAAPHEWGAASRLTARFGRFISAIEVEGWRFDGGSGRRASILAGYAW